MKLTCGVSGSILKVRVTSYGRDRLTVLASRTTEGGCNGRGRVKAQALRIGSTAKVGWKAITTWVEIRVATTSRVLSLDDERCEVLGHPVCCILLQLLRNPK